MFRLFGAVRKLFSVEPPKHIRNSWKKMKPSLIFLTIVLAVLIVAELCGA